jgi:hypothetical protein
VSALADGCEGEARRRLAQLAAEPLGGLDEAERAAKALRDILGWLRSRRERGEARALTARLVEEQSDPVALLREKQQQLERRRSSQGSPRAKPVAGTA